MPSKEDINNKVKKDIDEIKKKTEANVEGKESPTEEQAAETQKSKGPIQIFLPKKFLDKILRIDSELKQKKALYMQMDEKIIDIEKEVRDLPKMKDTWIELHDLIVSQQKEITDIVINFTEAKGFPVDKYSCALDTHIGLITTTKK